MLLKNSAVSGKVTARADSTGMENDKNVIIKHHHSVKKMQTPTVSNITSDIIMVPQWIPHSPVFGKPSIKEEDKILSPQ